MERIGTDAGQRIAGLLSQQPPLQSTPPPSKLDAALQRFRSVVNGDARRESARGLRFSDYHEADLPKALRGSPLLDPPLTEAQWRDAVYTLGIVFADAPERCAAWNAALAKLPPVARAGLMRGVAEQSAALREPFDTADNAAHLVSIATDAADMAKRFPKMLRLLNPWRTLWVRHCGAESYLRGGAAVEWQMLPQLAAWVGDGRALIAVPTNQQSKRCDYAVLDPRDNWRCTDLFEIKAWLTAWKKFVGTEGQELFARMGRNGCAQLHTTAAALHAHPTLHLCLLFDADDRVSVQAMLSQLAHAAGGGRRGWDLVGGCGGLLADIRRRVSDASPDSFVRVGLFQDDGYAVQHDWCDVPLVCDPRFRHAASHARDERFAPRCRHGRR